jgi:hypothetical protein
MADLLEIVFCTIAELLAEAVFQDGSGLARGLRNSIAEKSSEPVITLGLSGDRSGPS